MKRGAFGVVVAILVAAGLVFTAVNLFKDKGKGPEEKPPVAKITGVVGSEKTAFFNDPDVKAALAAQGLDVSVQSAGSWQMNDIKQGSADFVFPSSQLPADEIARQNQLTGTPARPFYSPLVIVAHSDVAKVLQNSKLAKQDPATKLWTFSMDEFLNDVTAKKLWEQLAPTDRPGSLSGDLFLTTTNPDTSSSGTLYVAMIAYLLNKHQVVQDQAVVDAIGPALKDVVTKQGIMKNSSDEPFKDFVSNVGYPLVLAYESQALDLVAKQKAPADMVMLYPDTTIVSDHTVVGFNANGRKLGEVLATDPTLRDLEVKHGFRPSGAEGAQAFASQVRSLNADAAQHEPRFAFATDLEAANVKRATVPAPEIMQSLIKAAKK
ncbi:hypothetical protein GCM10009639_58930 [Kitasatospora putterlickiae]|uniref:Extracellular solute-binding protein n=1 Tax=Kitasatospora putterlickiae TaxID=221725 RepID=A0ABN1YF12_9ACTN